MEKNGYSVAPTGSQLIQIEVGLTLCQPLSRRGYGPGMIIITSTVENSSPVGTGIIKHGIPSPLIKWAEEGYVTVEIQDTAFSKIKNPIRRAIQELFQNESCQPRGSVGLICYDPKSWKSLAPSIDGISELSGAAVYADASDLESFAEISAPCLYHLAGKSQSEPQRSKSSTVYHYPIAQSYLFATPFQADFHYSSESVSHTRNLSFLKRVMNGPHFDLEAIWDEHTYYEFEKRSVVETMATMVNEPYVNHIPTITGGIGRAHLNGFYQNHFIFSNPEDTELELISRTVGVDRIVDEFIFKFTHDSYIDWLLPGIPPTQKRAEVPFTAIVNVRGDRLYHEHISWDQGTLLAQLGLLPEFLPYPYADKENQLDPNKKYEYRLPVAGIQTANKMRDKNSVPSNGMFDFAVRERADCNRNSQGDQSLADK